MKSILLNVQGELGNLARGEIAVVVFLGAAALLWRQFRQLGRQDEEEAEEEGATAAPFFEWGRGGRGKSQV